MALPVTITGISTAVAPVGPFRGAQVYYTINAGVSSALPLGNATYHRVSQSFTTPSSGTIKITSVAVKVYKIGAPTDALQADIYLADSAGVPVGSSLATSTNTIAAAVVTTASSDPFTFTFASVSLSNSTKYAIAISRTGAQNATNYFACYSNGASVDATQTGAYYNGSSWVDANYDFNLTVHGGEGAFYFFGRDGTTATTLQAYKSTAPDTSWASVTTNIHANTLQSISAYQVGNVIHLLTGQTAASGATFVWMTFDTTTDTFIAGGGETVLSNQNTTGQTGTTQFGCSLVVRANSEVVAFYNGLQTNTSGTPRARIYYSRRTTPNTWSAGVRVDANTAVDNTTPIAVLGASDRVHFFWTAAGTGLRTLSQANALNTGTTNASMTAPGDGCSYLRGATTKVVVTSNAAGSQGTLRLDSADNPTVTFANQSIAAATIPHRIGADISNSEVTIAYRSSADSDLYVIKSTDDGATFGSPVSLFVGTVASADANLSRNSSGGMYQRGSQLVIGYVVNDGGTLKYNEYLVRTLDAWNANDKSATVTLSNSDKTATAPATGNAVRSTTKQLNGAGKYYAEFYLDSTGTRRIGIKLASSTITQTTNDFSVITNTGTIYINNIGSGSILGALTANDVLCVAWDAGVARVWFRKNNGIWNNDAAANPATNTNGIDVSFATAADHALWCYFSAAAATTLRTELADFTQSPLPSGFTSWMGEALPAPSGITMPAAVGAVALAGQTTGLRADRRMAADVGAVALAGIAAGGAKGTKMAAATGAITVAGQAVNLVWRHVYSMPAAKGSVVVTFNAATLTGTTAKKLTADPGAITVSMKAAGLRYGHALPAVKGSVVLAGQATALRATRYVIAAKGSIAVTGIPVNLNYRRAYILTAVKGSVVVTGYPAALGTAANKVMTASRGTVVVTDTVGAGDFVDDNGVTSFVDDNGVTVFVDDNGLYLGGGGYPTVLRATRTVPAAKGSVVLTGNAATLTKSTAVSNKVLAADPGAIALAGQQAALRAVRKITAAKGSVAVAGQAAALRAGRALVAAPGAIAVSGIDANLKYRRVIRMLAAPGNIVVTGYAAALSTKLDRAMLASPGAVVLSGKPAAFRITRALPVTTGAIVVSGAAVNLDYHEHQDYTLETAPTSVVVAGQRAELQRGNLQPGRITYGRRAYIPGRW